MAVFYSGDGGWRDLDKQISGVLAEHGIATVGVDSLRYFWEEKAPEQVADDLATILRHYRAAWGRQHAILLGYPSARAFCRSPSTACPPEEKARIRQISLLGLEKFALFEFHVTEWRRWGYGCATSPARDREAGSGPGPVLLRRGGGRHRLHGVGIRPGRADRDRGGHHFDGDYAALAEKIMAGARRRAESG